MILKYTGKVLFPIMKEMLSNFTDEDIELDSHFENDLYMDELDLKGFLMNLEGELEIVFNNDVLNCKSILQLIGYIQDRYGDNGHRF